MTLIIPAVLLSAFPLYLGLVWILDRTTGGPAWMIKPKPSRHEQCLANIERLEIELGLVIPEQFGIVTNDEPTIDLAHLGLPHSFEEVDPWAHAALLEVEELRSHSGSSPISRRTLRRSTSSSTTPTFS